jgi:PAS domain S-box-containing protein
MVARLATNLHWIAATPVLQQFLGQGLNSLVAHSFLDAVHPDDVQALKHHFEEVLKQGEGHNITFRIRAPGDAERHLQMDVYARYTDTGAPMHLRCHFLDVTDQVATEQELRRRTEDLSRAIERLHQANAALERLKESYRDLYNQTPALFFSLDPKGLFVACNDTLLRALGYAREELIGQEYSVLLSSQSRLQFQDNPAFFMHAGEIETEWVKKDGTLLDVWIRTTTQLDDQGRFERSRSAALDMTDRTRLANAVKAKADEVEKANIQLRRINQELEEFTHVVSHDLKEPLRTLQTFSSFLGQDYGSQLGPEGQEQIQYLIQASNRLGLLIDDLLNLSRAGRVINVPRAFDLGQAIQTVKSDLADLIQRKNAVVRIVGPLPAVAGDPDRVIQLLANLVGNGLKYNTSAEPEVVIGEWLPEFGSPNSQDTDVDPDHSHPRDVPLGSRKDRSTNNEQRTTNNEQVVLYVRDNGIGIDPRYHEQVFRIFRRLHHQEEYEGTGAGLAICKKVVEAHGGRIWLESEVGKGCTFYFTLPRSPESHRPVAEGSVEGNGEQRESTASQKTYAN